MSSEKAEKTEKHGGSGKNAKLSEKIFRTVLCVALAALTAFFLLGWGKGTGLPGPLLPGSIAVTLLLLLLGERTGSLSGSYVFFCLAVSGVGLPLLILSGTAGPAVAPVLCFAAVFFAALCTSRRRLLYAGLVLLTNSAAILAAGRCSADAVKSCAFCAVLSLSAGLIVSKIIDGYDEMTAILSRHMDISGINNLLLTTRESREEKGEVRYIAVMFADISNFTMLSETMSPESVARFLSVFFNITDKCIHENGGVLDKYVGDCTMAFWVDTLADGEAARQACLCAAGIRRELSRVCEAVNAEFGCDLECSIGINYGEAIVGDVGSVNRQDYTVIGDTVNVASRLESIAPGGTTYLSQSVAEIVQRNLTIRRVPKKVVLKGKCAPVDIYTLESDKAPDGESPEKVLEAQARTGFILHVCGSRGSFSVAGKRFAEFGGETSCYVLRRGSYALIIDCGSGLQRARDILEGCTKIDIIITHLHYDHIMGLLDWSIFPGEAELCFYGNFSSWLGEDSWHQFLRPPFWPVDISRGRIVGTRPYTEYLLQPDVKAVFYPATHPNEACLAVLTIRDRRICVMADCENPKDLPEKELRNASLLLFDGMYEDRYYSEHIGWGHSTWETGVRLAAEMQVERLVITHHNTRNSDEKLRGLEKAAQEIYPATTFAKAGDRYPI